MDVEMVDVSGSKAAEKKEQMTKEDKRGPLRISVTEKVIFCIDSMVFSDCDYDHTEEMLDILVMYIKVKKRISIKPVEFQCLIFFDNRELSRVEISEEEDLRVALLNLKRLRCEDESKQFDMNVLFTSLARMVELPHPMLCNEFVTPPWVYHCLFLFGNNFNFPIMIETNAFNFLIQSPFFSLDTIYIFNNSFEGNNCEGIAHALFSMYDIINGYFLCAKCCDFNEQYSVFAKLLGHPLVRPPQLKAFFNLEELLCEDHSD